MASTSFNQLPVEIHIVILKNLVYLSRWEWISRDFRSRSLFPFNVASVCTLWRDVLAQISECWTRVVFDVANDPAPFLSVFLWSKNLQELEVLVFNGSNDAEDTHKLHENRRVTAIAQALKPHAHRCKSIIFDVTFSSSLPPPNIFFLRDAPNLEELTLDCRVDDIDVGKYPTTIRRDRAHLATLFPQLKKMSLTGFWFFYLALHAHSSSSKWLKQLECERRISLHISQFKFQRDAPYNLQNLTRYISKREWSSLYLRDLTLSYEYDYPAPEPYFFYTISGDMHFQSVSKDFLVHLYTIADIDVDQSLSFKQCEIPILAQDQGGQCLILENIIDDDEGHSLRHILEKWNGFELHIDSCSSFNDTILSWLGLDTGRPEDIDFPVAGLGILTIGDCPNFSPRALRESLRLRHDAALSKLGAHLLSHYTLSIMDVSGNVPELTDEDKKWFEENLEDMTVNWKTQLKHWEHDHMISRNLQ